MKRLVSNAASRGLMSGLLILLLLAGLPVAVWLDLDRSCRGQSPAPGDRPQLRDQQRARLLRQQRRRPRPVVAAQQTQVAHNYENIPGAIPIPATLSHRARPRHQRAAAEHHLPLRLRLPVRQPRRRMCSTNSRRRSLTALRADPTQQIIKESVDAVHRHASASSRRSSWARPASTATIAIPRARRSDWKVGDVRGIQEVTIPQPDRRQHLRLQVPARLFRVHGGVAASRSSPSSGGRPRPIRGMNRELETTNDFLATISMKISRYLSPQVYKSIFSGQKDVTIHTERKKLTIFFSDIKDFTATTERLQPEQITGAAQRVFHRNVEHRARPRRHHRQVHRRCDAGLLRRPRDRRRGRRTRGPACAWRSTCSAARAAQHAKWRNAGIEQPFRVRMGINTGYCNVGNFGSADRMDYTIIGAEANLAARLQSIAEPRRHRHELRDLRAGARHGGGAGAAADHHEGHQPRGHALRGRGRARRHRPRVEIFSEHMAGLDFYLDPSMVDASRAEHVRELLQNALKALETTPAA